MGPRESKPKQQENVRLDKDEQEQVINHPMFKNRKIIEGNNSHDQHLNEIRVAVPSEKEYLAWKDQLTKLGVHDSLLLPQNYEFKKEGFCGSSGSVFVILC